MNGILIALLAAALLAGCMGPTDAGRVPEGKEEPQEFVLVAAEAQDGTRDAGQYWMVWAHGTEGQAGPRLSCSLDLGHRVDGASRTLEYDAQRYQVDRQRVGIVVAFDHFGGDECPRAHALAPDPSGPVTQAMGEWGTLTLSAREDGSLTIQGKTVPFGRAALFTYSAHQEDGSAIDGSFRVENLGAWDRAGLRPT